MPDESMTSFGSVHARNDEGVAVTRAQSFIDNDPELSAIANAPRKPRVQFGEQEIADNMAIMREILQLQRDEKEWLDRPTPEAREKLTQIRFDKESLASRLMRDERGVPISAYTRNLPGYVPPLQVWKVCRTCMLRVAISKGVKEQMTKPKPCRKCNLLTSWLAMDDPKIADYKTVTVK
jgi:hypothetical protein